MLKFKTEILLLVGSIVLFPISAFCYSYAAGTNGFTLALSLTYPYRAYAVLLISTGSVLMGIASFSYTKKNKHSL